MDCWANYFHISEFKDDPELYVYPKLRYVGVELWQVILLLFYYKP